jgi:hypothetical protein
MPNNEYAVLAKAVALKNDIINDQSMVKAVRLKQKQLRKKYAELNLQKTQAKEKSKHIRLGILGPLVAKWPELQTPYTLAYKNLLLNKVEKVQQWIVKQPHYPQLQLLQNSDALFEKQLLELERQLAQLDKVLRLRRIAYLKQWLYDYGNAENVAGYEKLLSCESSPL